MTGISPLGLTRAECAVRWILSCHLEAISVKTLSTSCRGLVRQEARPSAAPVPGARSPSLPARFPVSTAVKPGRASGPLLSLPFPHTLDPESNDTFRGDPGIFPCSISLPLCWFEGNGVQIGNSLKSPRERHCTSHWVRFVKGVSQESAQRKPGLKPVAI